MAASIEIVDGQNWRLLDLSPDLAGGVLQYLVPRLSPL
jgi:hypothetical protein